VQHQTSFSLSWRELLAAPPLALRLFTAALAVAMVAVLFHHGAQARAGELISAPWDKLAHATFYGAIAALAWIALGARGPWARYGAIAVAAGLGLVDELVQVMLPDRVASVADFAADVIGAVLAVWALSTLRVRAWSTRHRSRA
jgi:VanZ family protein